MLLLMMLLFRWRGDGLFGEMRRHDIVWILADKQFNDRSRAFVDEGNMRDQIFFSVDRSSNLIRRFGIGNDAAEPIENGVPHPTTIIVDREGIMRFIDIRQDFHIWLDPQTLVAELAKID